MVRTFLSLLKALFFSAHPDNLKARPKSRR